MRGEQPWYRFIRMLALRSSSELALVAVPDGTRERVVVLKRLPMALATDPTAVEKFRVEARIAALLEHPNIVRVHEIAETATDDFYTMEYVHGGDLRQLMDKLVEQKRTLPLDCVLMIAIELCNALDYAHHLTDGAGLPAPVIHRELSPSKVLLGVDGSVKLTGFGAPPLGPHRPRRSRTASVGYTSPERALGETLDSRSDLFALGVLLYELSSGERLFAEATTEHQIMMRIVRGDLPRPSEIRRGYPRELEAILMRVLAKDPKERFQSAADLQAELESFLWSRWPTASSATLAKLVTGAFPDLDVAVGSGELPRLDPNDGEPQLWLGPVPLAKPFPRAGEAPRTTTRELERLAPKQFPEASTSDVLLGRPGTRAQSIDDRVTTVASRSFRAATDLAIPVDDGKRAAVNANVLVRRPHDALALGTPGAKPAPIAAEPAATAEQPARGQYQRPEALDDGATIDILEKVRASSKSLDAIGKVAIARVATPVGLVRAEVMRTKTETPPEPATMVMQPHELPAELDLDQAQEKSWTLISTPPVDPIEAVKQRLPSPPPAAIASRKWPLATIAAVFCAVLVGVLGSAWAIKHTTHAPSDLPEVLAATPAPPTDLVVHVKRAEPPVAAAADKPVRAKPRVAKPSKPAPAAAPEPPPAKPEPVDPRRSLFPPSDPGSLDGIPYLTKIEVHGVVPEPAVRKAVGQVLAPLRACYRLAAREAQTTPQVDLTIGFELDHRRVPTKVRAIGGAPLDALATCASKVTAELRDFPPPTSGTARISVALEFRPN